MIIHCRRHLYILFSIIFLFISINCRDEEQTNTALDKDKDQIELVILGIAQDGGVPHANCQKSCCIDKWDNPDEKRNVVSLGILDHGSKQKWLIEATPDISNQLYDLSDYESLGDNHLPNGIFLTHAHIGHYTGLMYLGREVVGAKEIPVYAMPRMKKFLENNGPWNQLIELQNIQIEAIDQNDTIELSKNLQILPFRVPHRDEYSETVGFYIIGPAKSALFIPDINKWEIWDENIAEVVTKVDFAFLDGSFYDDNELPGRDMSEIPHPFVVESMELFKDLTIDEKKKIFFIHLNHTNPILDKSSRAYEEVVNRNFQIAEEGTVFKL